MARLHFLCLLLALAPAAWGEITVGSLHPLMADLVRQVGGDKVKIVEIGRPGFSVHTFQPKQKDLRALGKCHLVVASGKNIETYLGDLSDALDRVPILEVGRTIPSRVLSAKDSLYVCCPRHAKGTIDPHWWHDVDNMERAAKVVAKALAERDPANAAHYKARGDALAKRYDNLDRWVKSQVAKVPRKQRKLVTAHAAFGYFCAAYKFEAVFVKGLGADHEVPAKTLAQEVAKLKQERIRAVFPERYLNPKVLQQIARETGAKVGKPLVADGAVSSYEEMMRDNVQAIVSALATE